MSMVEMVELPAIHWVCRPLFQWVLDMGIYCTPETGGKPGTLHWRCGYERVK